MVENDETTVLKYILESPQDAPLIVPLDAVVYNGSYFPSGRIQDFCY